MRGRGFRNGPKLKPTEAVFPRDQQRPNVYFIVEPVCSFRFTFFNVENADEIKKGGKPSVKEVGDFAYKEVRRKEMILPVQDQISFGR